MLDFDTVDNYARVKELEEALAECLLALESIKDSKYKSDVGTKTKQVWSILRKCQKDAERAYTTYQPIL